MTNPDIIFFIVDQLAAKWLEAAQSGICPTPNIDRLQARGATFTNTITSNPVCMATRSTLATGLTSRGHGVLEKRLSVGSGAAHLYARLAAGWMAYRGFG